MENKYTGTLKDIKLEPVSGPIMQKRIVFSPTLHNWPGHVVRNFVMKAGEGNAMHYHEWPHWGLIVSGNGTAEIDGEIFPLTEKGWFYVPPRVHHRFQAADGEDLNFICMVPEEGDTTPVTPV